MTFMVISWVNPQPVVVTIRDNKDYIRVLLYSYYSTITGWGVFISYMSYDYIPLARANGVQKLFLRDQSLG